MATHPGSLAGKSHRQRSLWDTVHGVAKSWKQLSTHTTVFTDNHFPECILVVRNERI